MFKTLFSVPWHILIALLVGMSTLVPVLKASAEPVCEAEAPVITSEFLVNLALECSPSQRAIAARWHALRWEQSDLVNELREQLIRTHSVWIEGKEIYELYQEKLLPLSEEHLTVALQDIRRVPTIFYRFWSHKDKH